MRWLVACAAIWLPAYGASYYVDNRVGDDTHTGQATAPWKTLQRLEQSLRRGDTAYLAGGSIWHEPLALVSGVTYTRSGAAQLSNPLIDGSISLGELDWQIDTGHIFKASTGLPPNTIIRQVLWNGARLQRARHPNIGQGDWGTHSRYLKVADASPGSSNMLIGRPNAWPEKADLDNAEVFIRNIEYALLHYRVTLRQETSLTLEQISFDYPYEIKPGWGYWLENKKWMLDQAGEWFHDPVSQTLYVWLPSNDSPAHQNIRASVMPHAITGQGISDTLVEHIDAINTASDSILIERASNLTLRNLHINYAGSKGVNLTDSYDCLLDQLTVIDSHAQSIWMGDFRYPIPRPSSDITLTNSTIIGAGRGYYAHSAVMLGQGGRATNNRIDDSVYIGLHVWRDTTITGNLITNSCMKFDDCGALVTISRGEYSRNKGYPLDLIIEQNIIVDAPGSTDGSPHDGTSTRGLYLDDFSRKVTLKNNFVRGTDVGIQLHFARDNLIEGNTSIDNRWTQMWLQENAPSVFNCIGLSRCDSQNYQVNNDIIGNTFVAMPGQAAIWQNTDFESTSDFANYKKNRLIGSSPALFINTIGNQVQTSAEITNMETNSSSNISQVVSPEELKKWQSARHPRDIPKANRD